jgi:hypothetical protein
MSRTCRTAQKSTGRQPTRQLVPWNVTPQQESQHDSPQEDEPFEIVVQYRQGKTRKKLN